jgi:hypothetical protein
LHDVANDDGKTRKGDAGKENARKCPSVGHLCDIKHSPILGIFPPNRAADDVTPPWRNPIDSVVQVGGDRLFK